MAITVLLVDDDPSFLALAALVVEEIDAEVVATAPDARAAMEAAIEMRPDAALVDVWLPDRIGIELAYELAALPWRPRVVLMSTDPDAATAINAQDGRDPLPFVPKEQLAGARLRRLLIP